MARTKGRHVSTTRKPVLDHSPELPANDLLPIRVQHVQTIQNSPRAKAYASDSRDHRKGRW